MPLCGRRASILVQWCKDVRICTAALRPCDAELFVRVGPVLCETTVKILRELCMHSISYAFPSVRVCNGVVKLEYVSGMWIYGGCGGVGSTLRGGLRGSTPADVTRDRQSAGASGNRPSLLPHVPRVLRDLRSKD